MRASGESAEVTVAFTEIQNGSTNPQKSMANIKYLVTLLVAILIAVPNAFAGAPSVECPAIDASKNVFDASILIKDSRVAIEEGENDAPVVLSLYQQGSSACERQAFARYSVEGSAPTVDSLFFMKLKGKINVFTIVSWNINSRGDGTYGKLYQVYAYEIVSDGVLSENKDVVENGSMTGIDGYYGGTQSTFSYKTAAGVKKYWRGR
ncbi:hypothetical protein [Caballeronia glebae]|uniref:hypothetical protein n=1 Tax=Caballeronia glebae TaxID=1777143 RepID=UPI0038B8AA6C